MPVESVAELVGAIRQTQLLGPDQLKELDQFKSRSADARALARDLIQRGWLTAFQVNQLFKGQAQQLSLGQYVVLERLGEGGMGAVFKARHQRLDRIDALKVIRKDHLAHATAVKRFHQEAKAAARVSHPNIVAIYDASEIDGTSFLAMEFVEGTDLARLVRQKGPLPVAQACEYIRQAAVGLQHAHERGLVHRDIKPHNLLVSSLGAVKILDMGLARMLKAAQDDSATEGLTTTGAIMGTPDYLSPEQAMNSHEVDIRSDIYSLGCTLYFLLAGRPPFAGGELMGKLLNHRLDEPEPVEKHRPEVPPALGSVVRKMMAKKPADRYQTPLDVARALAPFAPKVMEATIVADRRLLNAAAPQALPVSETTAQALGFQKPAFLAHFLHSKRQRIIAGAAIGAALLLLAILLLFRGGKTTDGLLDADSVRYVKQGTREATILATVRANGLPTLEGKWYCIGAFGQADCTDFRDAFPPELGIDLARSYPSNAGPAAWKELPNFPIGIPIADIRQYIPGKYGTFYFYHSFDSPGKLVLPVTLRTTHPHEAWLNGKVLTTGTGTGLSLNLEPGKNSLLLKTRCIERYTYDLFIMPTLPVSWRDTAGARLDVDFPEGPVLEGENLLIRARSGDFFAGPQDIGTRHSWWRGNRQLLVKSTAAGDWVDLEIPIPERGVYAVAVYVTKAPEHGIVQFELQNRPIGSAVDCYHPDRTINSGAVWLGKYEFQGGAGVLRCKVISTNQQSRGSRYGWGLDCVVLRRE